LAEVCDLLLHPIFIDSKLTYIQIRDETVGFLIDYGDQYVDCVNLDRYSLVTSTGLRYKKDR
jgi:hypothetical protein